jgi:hypothetical protein
MPVMPSSARRRAGGVMSHYVWFDPASAGITSVEYKRSREMLHKVLDVLLWD